jgi:hypothetical protein
VLCGIERENQSAGIHETEVVGSCTVIKDADLFSFAPEECAERQFTSDPVGVGVDMRRENDIRARRQERLELFEFFHRIPFYNKTKKGVIEESTTPFLRGGDSIIQ